MSAVAFVPTDLSSITVTVDETVVADAPLERQPLQPGQVPPFRSIVVAALRDLGYQPVDYLDQREVAGGVEFDVEVTS